MSDTLHCLECFQPIAGDPVWVEGFPKCQACSKEKVDDSPQDDKPTITAAANPKCTNCWGRGRVRTQTTKPPPNLNIKNVKMAGGAKITVNQWCGCVLTRANKQAKAMGLKEGEQYNIKLKGEK